MNIDVQRHSISIIAKKHPSKQLRHRHPTTASAFHRNQVSHGTGASFDYGSMKKSMSMLVLLLDGMPVHHRLSPRLPTFRQVT